jgi:exfoliative toxin A/B
MDTFLKKLPIPIAGLMLALAAGGNLLVSNGLLYKNIFGFLSGIIATLLILKFFRFKAIVFEQFENPVIASVLPTFSMGLMVLSTYFIPLSRTFAYGLWIVGILVHMILIVAFSNKYIVDFNIKKVFPSYFIVYVGIVCASVTAPAYGRLIIGQSIFWFGFISYLLLLPIVLYRVIKIKNIPAPALPTITIIAAPASLCLAGYMSAFSDPNLFITNLLLILSLTSLLGVLLYMPQMLSHGFYPSFSAFTFPLVISAIAVAKTQGFFVANQINYGFLKTIVMVEKYLSIIAVIYVLYHYLAFLYPKDFSKSTNAIENGSID